ncbi:MAG: hypothetical protein ABI068_03230 [Ktedonobacterales bacterium]
MKPKARWNSILALLVALALTSCGLPSAATTPTQAGAATATPASNVFRPDFERGMAFPRWGQHVYGLTDTSWAPDVQAMQTQTGTGWIEMTVNLYQQTYTSTSVFPSAGTPAPDDLYSGVLNAREAGLHVFLEPILSVLGEPADPWGGRVHFSTEAQAQRWFQAYWATYKPYVVAASQAGVSQISIGTEYDALENSFPDQWRWLLAQVRTVFSGPTTYAINHGSFAKPLPSWMTDPNLTYVGASMYMGLTAKPEQLTEPQIEALWTKEALPLLDALSRQAGKPVVISEVGYRDTSDALFEPWLSKSTAPVDTQLQAAAYQAAVRASLGDPHIQGIFFWAWDNGIFSPDHQPAAQALHSLYLSPNPLALPTH